MLNACRWLLTTVSRLGEFVARLPSDQRRLIRSLPSQCDSELRHHCIATEIHLRMIFVARLMVVLRDIVLRLLLTPFAVMILILVAFIDGECRHPRARKAKVVGAIVVAGAGLLVGHNGQF